MRIGTEDEQVERSCTCHREKLGGVTLVRLLEKRSARRLKLLRLKETEGRNDNILLVLLRLVCVTQSEP